MLVRVRACAQGVPGAKETIIGSESIIKTKKKVLYKHKTEMRCFELLKFSPCHCSEFQIMYYKKSWNSN